MQIVLVAAFSVILGALAYRQLRWVRRYSKQIARMTRNLYRKMMIRSVRGGQKVVKCGYVRDLPIDFCTNEFVLRARSWKFNANVSFYFSLASVLVGICIFIFADRIALNNPELQRLVDRREELQKQIESSVATMDSTEREHIIATELLQDWRLLRSPIISLTAARFAKPSEDVRKELQVKILMGREDAVRIEATLRKLGLVNGDRSQSLYREADLEAFRKLLDSENLETAHLAEFYEKYLSLLRSVNETLDDQQLSSTTAAHLIAEKIQAATNGVFEALVARVDKEASGVKVDTTSNKFTLREAQLQLRGVNEQIAIAEKKVDPQNLYSVIPLLVVRLGAVILLIFLTQILLAAYRYNTMLYTHYASIADALRIVPSRWDGEGPDYALLEKLVSILQARETSYTLPPSPIADLVRLARPGKE